VSTIALLVILAGVSTPHTVTQLTYIRAAGHERATYVEAGALILCDGTLTAFNDTTSVTATLAATRCVPDVIFRSNFQ
jgi:hypothetical protein